MFKDLFNKAKEAIEKSEIKEALNSAYESTSVGLSSVKEWAGEKYDQYYPMIEKAVVHGLLEVTEDRLQDLEFIEAIFQKAYEVLPIPVRLTFSRTRFMDFCHAHRESLLEAAVKYKTEKVALTNVDVDATESISDHSSRAE